MEMATKIRKQGKNEFVAAVPGSKNYVAKNQTNESVEILVSSI